MARATWRSLGRGHRTALVLTALFCLVVAVRGAILGLREQGNDFTIYYDAARALLAGRSPIEVVGPAFGSYFVVSLQSLHAGPKSDVPDMA